MVLGHIDAGLIVVVDYVDEVWGSKQNGEVFLISSNKLISGITPEKD